MSKNIVFCADGIWRGPGQDEAAPGPARAGNVYHIFVGLKGEVDEQSLLLANEQEKVWRDSNGDVAQVAKYIHGNGDVNNQLARLLGGAFGAELIVPLVRGYTFISRHYTPGDRIWLVGFSHGAYTARVLADMILDRGVLNRERLNGGEWNRLEAYRMAASLWAQYRAHAPHSDAQLLGSVLRDLPGFFCNSVDPRLLISNVAVEAVAVWETVGVNGIPRYWQDKRTAVFRFHNQILAARVKYGLQAIAIDEQRLDFSPVVWENRERILQVLFPGIHEDIGGGLDTADTESGLANGACRWMHDVLDDLGLALHPCHLSGNGLGPLHCAWYPPTPWLRIVPRSLPPPVHSAMMIHQTAINRLHPGEVPYQSAQDGTWLRGSYQPAALRGLMGACGEIPQAWVVAY